MTLSMTSRVDKLQTDAVDDFTDVNLSGLHGIGAAMKTELDSYSQLISSEPTPASTILESIFKCFRN